MYHEIHVDGGRVKRELDTVRKRGGEIGWGEIGWGERRQEIPQVAIKIAFIAKYAHEMVEVASGDGCVKHCYHFIQVPWVGK